MESCCSCNKFSDTKDELKETLNAQEEIGLMIDSYEEDYMDKYSDEGTLFEDDYSKKNLFRSLSTKKHSNKIDGEKLLEDLEEEDGGGWKEQQWNLENEDVVMMLEQYLEDMKKQDK